MLIPLRLLGVLAVTVVAAGCDRPPRSSGAPYDSVAAFFARFRAAVITGDRSSVATSL